MLYRDGDNFEWDGRPTDSLIADQDGMEAALADGWKTAADYLATPVESNAPRRGRPPKIKEFEA